MVIGPGLKTMTRIGATGRAVTALQLNILVHVEEVIGIVSPFNLLKPCIGFRTVCIPYEIVALRYIRPVERRRRCCNQHTLPVGAERSV